MRAVITARQGTISPSELDQFMKDCYIGNGDEISTPFEALIDLEEEGHTLEVTINLKSGLERIGFISLHPLPILKDYANLVCVLVLMFY